MVMAEAQSVQITRLKTDRVLAQPPPYRGAVPAVAVVLYLCHRVDGAGGEAVGRSGRFLASWGRVF